MNPSEVRNMRILISPLNWGMGHVSRCIGLIDQLTQQGNTVLVACDKNQKKIFLEYFPDIEYIQHEGYPFDFGGKGRFTWDMLSRFLPLRQRLIRERLEANSLVDAHDIDVVISDHRYGFRSRNAYSIFVTHQFNLPLKWFEFAVARAHRRMMFSYDKIWIMDYDDCRLAGKLSVHGDKSKVSYVGPYSRFMLYSEKPVKDIEKILVASGPNIYAQRLIDKECERHKDMVVICSETMEVPKNCKKISGSWKEQDQLIMRASHVVSRPGYSTIMDLELLNTPATYYPTKGQREQQCLFDFHAK